MQFCFSEEIFDGLCDFMLMRDFLSNRVVFCCMEGGEGQRVAVVVCALVLGGDRMW